MARGFAEDVPRWLAGECFIKVHELLAEGKVAGQQSPVSQLRAVPSNGNSSLPT